VWGEGSSNPLLCGLLDRALLVRKNGDGERVADIVELLLFKGADPSARRSQKDWRGSGSSTSVFNIAMDLRKSLPNNATFRVMKSMLEFADAKTFQPNKRYISSMRSDGYEQSNILHEMVEGLNGSTRVEDFKLLVAKMATLGLMAQRQKSDINNERGFHSHTSENALHVLLRKLTNMSLVVVRTKGNFEAEVNRVAEELKSEMLSNRASALQEWTEQRDKNIKNAKLRKRAMGIFRDKVSKGEMRKWKLDEMEKKKYARRGKKEMRRKKRAEIDERRAEMEERRAERKKRRDDKNEANDTDEDGSESDGCDSEESFVDEDEDVDDDGDNFFENSLTYCKFFSEIMRREEIRCLGYEEFDADEVTRGVHEKDLRSVLEEFDIDYIDYGGDKAKFYHNKLHDYELEVSDQPSDSWWSDFNLPQNIEEVTVTQFEDEARACVTAGLKLYQTLLRFLAILLDSTGGVDGGFINSIAEDLTSTRNEEWHEGVQDDPREEGFVYRNFHHLRIDGALSLMLKGGRDAKVTEGEKDFQARKSSQVVRVTASSLRGQIEVLYMLRLKGLDVRIGSACERDKWGYFSDWSERDLIAASKGSHGAFIHTAFELEDGNGGGLEAAWKGIWIRSSYAFMSENGRARVECVMMALRRKEVPGDIGEVIIGYLIAMEGMEGRLSDYF